MVLIDSSIIQSKVFFTWLAQLVQDNRALFTLILAWFGFRISQKNYEDNNAPAIVPDSSTAFDLENQTVRLKNLGKGVAKNVEIGGYRYLSYVDPMRSEIVDWKLSSTIIGIMPPNTPETVEMSDNKILFSYFFGHANSRNRTEKKRSTMMFIEYQNLNGVRFYTKLSIRNKHFVFHAFGRDRVYYRLYRTATAFLSYYFVRGKMFFKVGKNAS